MNRTLDIAREVVEGLGDSLMLMLPSCVPSYVSGVVPHLDLVYVPTPDDAKHDQTGDQQKHGKRDGRQHSDAKRFRAGDMFLYGHGGHDSPLFHPWSRERRGGLYRGTTGRIEPPRDAAKPVA